MTAHEWSHVERSRLAFEDAQGRSAGASRGAVPEELEAVVRYWVDGDRFRQESEGPGRQMTMVSDGEQTWSWTPESGAVVYDRGTMTTNEHELLNPIALVVAFELEPTGRGEVAGRAVVRVRARPRDPESRMHSLGFGADELELAVDAERGVLLRAEARHDGSPFRVVEVRDVEFDVELPESTFVFEAPEGEEVRAAGEAYPFDYVTIEDAAREATFTVWVPGGLDERWRHTVVHRPASERPQLEESVHLLFHDDALHSFSLEEAAVHLLAWRDDASRVVELDGVEFRVYDGKPLEVHLQRGGTHVRITSDTLDADVLLAIGASLVEAPREPPDVF
jgi:outer membrane lipoprotein-sorting protein